MNESDLCRLATEWLTAEGWDVYPEVVGYSGRCDLYAVRAGKTWAIEAKNAFTFRVIEQAENWRRQAHYASVLIPGVKAGPAGRRICSMLGVGVLLLQGSYIVENVRPSVNRRPNVPELREEMKRFEGGNNENGYWTPFRSTRWDLERYVKAHPGCSLKEAIDHIDHHYSSPHSARGALSNLLQRGALKEFQVEKVGRSLRIYPAGQEMMPHG